MHAPQSNARRELTFTQLKLGIVSTSSKHGLIEPIKSHVGVKLKISQYVNKLYCLGTSDNENLHTCMLENLNYYKPMKLKIHEGYKV